MGKKFNLFFLIFAFIFNQQAFCGDYEINKSVIKQFISIIKQNNYEELSRIIHYPLNREYPLPPINNAKDFIDNHEEIFDDNLKNIIIKSNIDKDWQAVGWRGIMLNEGLLWLDYDGSLITINYNSEKEKEHYNKILSRQKEIIYPALSNFKSIKGMYKTDKYRFRIDKLEDDSYRYVSWKKDRSISTKPDIIINNCSIKFDGSGGNHSYICKNGNYYYIVGINRMGTSETPPADLTVYKVDKNYIDKEWKPSYLPNNVKEILYEPANIVNE